MTQTYRARAGDVLDDVAWRHYGTQNAEILRQVYAANPALTRAGPVLAEGVIVQLPAIEAPAAVAAGVALWD